MPIGVRYYIRRIGRNKTRKIACKKESIPKLEVNLGNENMTIRIRCSVGEINSR